MEFLKSLRLVGLGTPSGLQKQIDKGVKAIMKKYPVTPQQPLMLHPDKDVMSD